MANIGIKIASCDNIGAAVKVLRGFSAKSISEIKAAVENKDFVLEVESYDNEELSKVEDCYKKLEAAGVESKDIPTLTAEETKYILDEGTDRATQMEIIQGMKIPELFKNRLIENNTDKIYSKLGVSNFYHYVASYMTKTIMNVIGNAVTFLGILLILLIICLILGSVVREVPVLAGVDKLGGMILGGVIGLALVWIFMTIASIAMHDSYNSLLGGNPLLVWLDENNLFAKIIMSFKA
jgi:hypothetical protein